MQKCNIRTMGIQAGSRDLLVKFCLDIAEMVEATNFKLSGLCTTSITQKCKIMSKGVAYFQNVGTP